MAIPFYVSEPFFLLGGVPLLRAWQANRHTTLMQALGWATATWIAWGTTLAADSIATPPTADTMRYFALCLTACAGVAVLGARRPGVGAWNFVVFGLLAVMLLPLAEGTLTGGSLHLAWPRLLFLAGTLALMALNYLPTRLGPAALCLAFGSALHLMILAGPEELNARLRASADFFSLTLTAALLLADYGIRSRPAPASEFDTIWLAFRDRFGVLWGQRMREQFNRAAANAGWPVYLRWQGLRLLAGTGRPNLDVQTQMVTVLRALLQRFGTERSDTCNSE
jgi:hypothetical protein